MSGFYIINEKRFPLQVENFSNVDMLPYYRWDHRVTLGYNGRRFIVFIDNLKQEIYIEEYTTKLEKISDDSLWKGLFEYATQKGFLMILSPMLKPKNVMGLSPQRFA